MSPDHQGATRADPYGLWQIVDLDRDEDDPRRKVVVECSREADGSFSLHPVGAASDGSEARAA